MLIGSHVVASRIVVHEEHAGAGRHGERTNLVDVARWPDDERLHRLPVEPQFHRARDVECRHVQFEGGGRMMLDFTDVDADTLEVGQSVRMMFRIKDYDAQRGFTRYFWKAAPANT